MRNLLVSSAFLISILFLCNTAFAFPLGIYFDKDGGANFGDVGNTFYGVGYGSTVADNTDYTSLLTGNTESAGIITNQNFGTDEILGNNDRFVQEATFSINAALNESATDYGDGRLTQTDNWQLDLNLEGYIDGYSSPVQVNTSNPEDIQGASFTSKYDGGSARIYHEEGGAETDIANFTFTAGTDIELQPTLWGGGGNLGDSISFSFDWTDANHAYLGDELFDPSGTLLSDLITLNLAFASSQDSIRLIDDLGVFADGVQVLTTTTGGKAEFQAVPEPTTMLLFGTGLLGLGFFGRRKFMKKNS